MAEWRYGPDGQKEWLGRDGNWYSSERLAIAASAAFPRGPYVAPAPSPTPVQAPIGAYPVYQSEASTLPAGAFLAITAGGLIAIGAFLPWFSVSAAGSVTRNAFQLGNDFSFSADGVVLLLVGIVAALIGVVRLTKTAMPRWIQSSTILPGVVAIAAVVNRYGSIQSLANQMNASAHGLFVASVGYGIWLPVAGGALAIVAGLILRSNGAY